MPFEGIQFGVIEFGVCFCSELNYSELRTGTLLRAPTMKEVRTCLRLLLQQPFGEATRSWSGRRRNTRRPWRSGAPTRKWDSPTPVITCPIIYGILGIPVKTLGDMKPILERCRALIPPPVKEKTWLPYLAPALDAGMATFFAEEIIEAIRYLEDPNFYVKGEDPTTDNLWLGAADDVILRKRGIEFVDGTAPGFAAILGAAPTKEIAAKIAQELQEKNLYVFMAAEHNGKRFSEQLVEAGVQIGWPTRLVSFGPDYTATVFAMGFATRAAMSFGGIAPGRFPEDPHLQQGPGLRLRPARSASSPTSGTRTRPGPSTGGSRSSPTRPFPRSCPRGSAPTSTWSPTSPTTRSSRKRSRSGG